MDKTVAGPCKQAGSLSHSGYKCERAAGVLYMRFQTTSRPYAFLNEIYEITEDPSIFQMNFDIGM